MKKSFLKFVTGIAMAFAVACVFVSCGPSADDINKKISSGAQLEDADYSAMASYIESTCLELIDLLDDDFDNPDCHADRVEALKNMEQKYPYFITFGRALYNAPEGSAAEQEIKDKELTIGLLYIAGLPERKKADLPEEWRSPFISFKTHSSANAAESVEVVEAVDPTVVVDSSEETSVEVVE